MLVMPTYLGNVWHVNYLTYTAVVATDDTSRWMPAWLALLRTHARLWDELEAQVRRDHGLTIARYDVLTHLEMAGGQLRLSELSALIVLSPSGLSKLLDRMAA